MSKYVKYAGELILFGIIFAVLLGLVSLPLNPKDSSPEAGMKYHQAMGVFAEPEDSLDVLFFGDSLVGNAVSPLVIYENEGFTSYNCSIYGEHIPTTLSMMNDVLDERHPQLVVLDMAVAHEKLSKVEPFGRILKNMFPAIMYHNRWKTLTLADLDPVPHYRHQNPDKGMIPFSYAVAGEVDLEELLDDTDENIPPLNTLYAEQIVNLCERKGVDLVLISVPTLEYWDMGRHDANQAFADEHGLIYYDMNLPENQEFIQIDWEADTWDSGKHLNVFGATKVSDALGAWLTEHYQLPDHRDDPAYADWAKSVADHHARFDGEGQE